MRLRGSSLSRRYSLESICDLSVSIPVLDGKERWSSGMCRMLGGECRELAGMSQSFSASRMCPLIPLFLSPEKSSELRALLQARL